MSTTIFVDFLRGLANEFDDHTYPVAVYEALLGRVQVAQKPEELGEALAEPSPGRTVRSVSRRLTWGNQSKAQA